MSSAAELRKAADLFAVNKEFETVEKQQCFAVCIFVVVAYEIAAQLAELNENLRSISQIPVKFDATIPVKFDAKVSPSEFSGHYDVRTR